jgi:hypothetical protein
MVSRTAELDLVVGSLITVREAENRKIFKQQQAIAEQIQAQLHGAGIDYDFLFEPGTVVWTGSIETLDALYHLQRLAVRLEHGRDVAQVLAEGPVLTDDLDSMVTNIWEQRKTTQFPHLLYLKGINSYYLPLDFSQALWLPFKNIHNEQDEAYFGSAIRLQKELAVLKVMLDGIELSSDSPTYRCFETLLTASTLSQQARLPAIIW